jgi:hypothetical protein
MNLSRRTSLSLLFVSLSTIPANAALSADGAPAGISFETSSSSSALQPLDELLGGSNHADLYGSLLKKHESSAQSAKSTMDGHFERDGSEQPVQLSVLAPSPSSESAAAPNLSLAAIVHLGAQPDSNPATATSPSTTAPTAPVVTTTTSPDSTVASTTSIDITTTITPSVSYGYTTTVTPIAPVPLPAAGLLLASGLVGISGMRKRQRQE